MNTLVISALLLLAVLFVNGLGSGLPARPVVATGNVMGRSKRRPGVVELVRAFWSTLVDPSSDQRIARRIRGEIAGRKPAKLNTKKGRSLKE
jgi:hypothetical protein